MKNNASFSDFNLHGGSPADDSSFLVEKDFDSKNLRDQERDRYEQDTRYRKNLAIWVMSIVPGWLIFVLVLVFLCSASVFALSDNVMIALLATTTANVLGLAFIVLKGIFSVRD